MNKKANMISSIIILVIAIIIITSVAIPIISLSTRPQSASESMEVGTGVENATYTLLNDYPVSGSVSISGLTVTSNYTVDYDTGIVTFVNNTMIDNYTGAYSFTSSSYVTDSVGRSMLGVVIVALLVGLVVMALSMIG